MSRPLPRAFFVSLLLLGAGPAFGAEPPAPGGRVAGFALLGAAGATAATGLGFGLSLRAAERAHQRATTDAERTRTADSARERALTANVLFAAAGALGAAGVTLVLVQTDEARADVGPAALVSPSAPSDRIAAGLAVRGAF